MAPHHLAVPRGPHRAFLIPSLLCLLSAGLAAQSACLEPSLGANLFLSDDSVAQRPLGFTFPGPGGANVTTVSISSNGFVWMGINSNNGCCSGNLGAFLSQGPRIAPMWTDLDPSSGGGVFFNTFPAAGGAPARAVITWNGVPEFGTGNNVTAQLQMSSDGSFSLAYGASVSIQNHTTLVGVTRGLGAPQNPVNLSAIVGATVHDSGSNATVHEVFSGGSVDLANRSFEFRPNGIGGYRVSEIQQCRNASFVRFGRGCPSQPTIYELFPPGSIDLTQQSFRFAPNGVGGWNATVSRQPVFTGVSNMVATADDEVVAGIPLPFTWNHPGGSTNSIDVSTNGCVYLVSGSILDARCCDGSPQRFLQEAASIAVLWLDLYPPGGGAVFVDQDTTGQTVYVTWLDCPEYGNSAVLCTAQLVLEASGAFELRYGTVSNVLHTCLVGYTGGSGATDPGSLDLSTSLPFSTGPGGIPLRLDAAAGSRPAVGATFTLVTTGVPPGAIIGFLGVGPSRLSPPLDLTAQGVPGCFQHVTVGASVSFAITGTTGSVPILIPNDPGLIGAAFFGQSMVHVPGVNALGLLSSNGGEVNVGL